MILSCPLCQTRYLIPASLFAAGPRRVRCAKCSHSWQAETPSTIDVFAPPPLESPSMESPPPIPPGSNLPAVIKKPWPRWAIYTAQTTAVVIALLFILWFVFDRKDIVKDHPFMVTLYDRIGLHVYFPGEGLVLSDVRSELKYMDGIMKLEVEGDVTNTTSRTQTIPLLTADAVGSDGVVLQSWKIDIPASKVSYNSAVPFKSSINAPKGTVVNVNLTFSEKPDADN